MADQVYPRDSPPGISNTRNQPENSKIPSNLQEKVPPPGTYVVQVPKDQIYRTPPPENARKYQNYSRRKTNRSCCSCCFCLTLILIVILILLITIFGVIFFFVVRPEAPNYSVENLSVKGFNLTLSDLTFSPEFDVTVRAQNPNKDIGIYYEEGSSVTFTHLNVQLCNGSLPAFYQQRKNVTIFTTVLESSGVKLTTEVRQAITEEQNRGKIPLGLNLKVPVRIKVGFVRTWTVTVEVDCDVIVDKLTVDSRIVSKSCDVRVVPWKN